MRLREIQNLLISTIEKLDIQFTAESNGYYCIKNIIQTVDALEELDATIPVFKSKINELRAIPKIYNCRLNQTFVELNTSRLFEERYTQLYNGIELLINTINVCLSEEKENTIYVKLPKYNSLSDISKFTQDLDTSLSQIITHKDIGGTVYLNNFDSGSIWFEICLGTAVALNVVTKALQAALSLQNQLAQNQLVLQQVRASKLQNEAIEQLNKELKEHINAASKSSATEILKDMKLENTDNEYADRVMNSIKTLATLIKEGTEVQICKIENNSSTPQITEFKLSTSTESLIKFLEQKK